MERRDGFSDPPRLLQEVGPGSMDRAIERLESEHGDAMLAAEAHLIKARLLHFYKLDWNREPRAEAQRAARAFARLPRPDALNVARAGYVEALALKEMSADGESVNPTSDEAGRLANTALEGWARRRSSAPSNTRARSARKVTSISL